jgi:capsular polysaccharide export protein
MARVTSVTGENRRFLFLQGPHGPFFYRLSKMLRATGAETLRVGFNRGDQAFWPDKSRYVPFTGPLEAWESTLRALIADHGISDIALYGDTRPIHEQAVKVANELGLTVHVFEEGCLRPFWVTYERGGSNGHSRLAGFTMDEVRARLHRADHEMMEIPDHWGDMRQHIFYGALYHLLVLCANRRYRALGTHRSIPVSAEFRLYLKRLLLMPWLWAERAIATARIRAGGFPYHVTLLQLDHDASFLAHSGFASSAEFLRAVVDGFAAGAPSHHHLVVKAHPLEDGRGNPRAALFRLARQAGIAGRVHYLRGGKLARLLDHARSAVTVNSTAGQQVLYRGLPLRTFGASVYAKPELVSGQPVDEFFATPKRPDRLAYRDFRQFLLETSQIAGGFYSTRGRRQLLRLVVDMMLLADDPYDALNTATAAPRQHLNSQAPRP